MRRHRSPLFFIWVIHVFYHGDVLGDGWEEENVDENHKSSNHLGEENSAHNSSDLAQGQVENSEERRHKPVTASSAMAQWNGGNDAMCWQYTPLQSDSVVRPAISDQTF